MSDMYTQVLIDNPGDLTTITEEERERDDFPGYHDYDVHAFMKERTDDAWDDGTDETEGCAGWSNYQIDGIHAFGEEYTTRFPGSTVTITEEWHGEGGPSTDVTVWRNGEQQPAESKHDMLVPDNLDELIAAVRTPLSRYYAIESDDDPGYHQRSDAAFDLIEHARALVDALDPKETK